MQGQQCVFVLRCVSLLAHGNFSRNFMPTDLFMRCVAPQCNQPKAFSLSTQGARPRGSAGVALPWRSSVRGFFSAADTCSENKAGPCPSNSRILAAFTRLRFSSSSWAALSGTPLASTVTSQFPSSAGAFARVGGGSQRGRWSEFAARLRSLAEAPWSAAKTEVRGNASLF